MNELEEMKGLGLSVTAISELTGYDRKTVRKYLLEPRWLRHTDRGKRCPVR
jgi:transposase